MTKLPGSRATIIGLPLMRLRGGLAMKRRSFLVLALLLAPWIAPVASAAPEDEVAQIVAERIQTFNDGNLDAFMATWADNATLTPGAAPFRLDGKQAIHASFASTFQNFPTHRYVGRQESVRIYNGTTAVYDAYYTVTLVDRAGKATVTNGRITVVLVKLGSKWLAVDQHASPLPVSQ